MSGLKNLFKGTMGFAVIAVLVLFGLRFLAREMNAGAEGFRLSLPFLIAQAAVIVGCYVTWYRKVSREAVNMMNIEKMRKMAFYYKRKYFTTSAILTILIVAIDLVRGYSGSVLYQLRDNNGYRRKPCFVSADAVCRTAKSNYRGMISLACSTRSQHKI